MSKTNNHLPTTCHVPCMINPLTRLREWKQDLKQWTETTAPFQLVIYIQMSDLTNWSHVLERRVSLQCHSHVLDYSEPMERKLPFWEFHWCFLKGIIAKNQAFHPFLFFDSCYSFPQNSRVRFPIAWFLFQSWYLFVTSQQFIFKIETH